MTIDGPNGPNRHSHGSLVPMLEVRATSRPRPDSMQRTIVQIARIRLIDVRVGDIVSGRPDEEFGWFEVMELRELPSGDLVASGSASTLSVKGSRWDLVGVQVAKTVEIPGAQRLAATPTAATN